MARRVQVCVISFSQQDNNPFPAGKTILASLIIDHLQKERADSTTSYFYCREMDEGLGEPRFLAIMKSLLRQLVSQNEDLLPTLHDKRMRGQEILNDESAAKTLLELFCELDMSQFIIVDGLDEMSDVHRRSVVEFFDSIVEKSNEHHPGKIRILILSTELPLIRKRMESNDRIGEFALNPGSTLKDIESYVAKQAEKLEEGFSLDSHNLKLIEALICRNSDGNGFPWLALLSPIIALLANRITRHVLVCIFGYREPPAAA